MNKAIGTYWKEEGSVWGPYKIITYDVSEYSSYPDGKGAHVEYANPRFGGGDNKIRIILKLESVASAIESSEAEYLLWSIK